MRHEENLLLFTEISDKGGIQVMGESIIKVLSATSKKINHIVLLKNKTSPGKYKNIKFYCCGSEYAIIRRFKFLYYISFLLITKKIKRLYSNHLYLLKPHFFLYRLLNIKFAFIAYGIEIFDPSKFEKKIIRSASEISVPSKFTRNKISPYIEEDFTKINLLPPLADSRTFHIIKPDMKIAKKHSLNQNDKIILTVSRLDSREKYKGYDKIIQVLPRLKKKYKNIKYILVGTGDDEERIRKLIKKYKLKDSVILAGFVDKKDLVDYYNLCEIFSMPSTGEGFGIVFLEALLCGKPVIAGNLDGSVDPLLDGKTGVIVDPNNLDELNTAFIKILERKGPKNIFDANFLRNTTIENFGEKKFKERAKKSLYFLDSDNP